MTEDHQFADNSEKYLIDFIDDGQMIFAESSKDAIEFCEEYAHQLEEENDLSDFVCRPFDGKGWEGEGICGRSKGQFWK